MLTQERKNKLLTLSLVLLAAATLTIVYFRSSADQSIVDKNLFKVTDLKTIDGITLTSTRETIQLKFNGTRWLVNNKYPADRTMIEVLFATLLQAEPKRAVAASVRDSIRTLMKKNGVRVELFEKDKKQLTFTSGTNAQQSQSYFEDGEGNLFVMSIPGYRVNVSAIYALPETEWRDKYVFGFNWTNFKKLEIDFANSTSDDFAVKMQDGLFGVEGIATDTAKLNSYLDAISLLRVEQYQTIDSLSKLSEVATLTVFDVADRTWQLKVLNRNEGDRTACLLNNDQLAWLDNRKLDFLLKRRNFFAKKP
jgi:hypothetical protein